jgi:hypothetical protein
MERVQGVGGDDDLAERELWLNRGCHGVIPFG